MGIKNFSKVFKAEIIKDVKDKRIAIDASLIIYQASLGIKSNKLLTDPDGNPTIHINVIIGKCLKFIKNNNICCWVFDYYEKGYVSPYKQHEHNIRTEKKKKAEKKIESLKEELFSSDDDEILKQEKTTFSINENIINDCKFILECFNMKFMVSPKDVEAEAVCAKLTENDYDLVWSCDTDALLYGAKNLVRELNMNGKKCIQLYQLDKLLSDNDITINDLCKIGIILGSDHAPKTPRVGPKTVLKKYKDIELTEPQTKAMNIFKTNNILEESNIQYDYNDNYDINESMNKLLSWVETKGFNVEKMKVRIDKVMPNI